ncbi:MAG: AAA family ATPase [Bryobacteraceae bacterium]|nr:AAA family ATPase [Bryobacteraceae bacterium]MDW8377659.1 AAA family ATPase [Bryobacterales bacterium]
MAVANRFPFCAIAGQPQLKLCLLLAAVDWRLSCLIRGDKGSGKSTAARALAEILPGEAPFINVPIGVTEDRLLGGLSLDAAFQGKAALQPGLIHAADGGVLYLDEVNLLAGQLTDALLDVSATGRYVLERDGFSQESRAHFILLGSMNPEEGQLRPQLRDRFALAVDVEAPETAEERVEIIKLRAAFDRDPEGFVAAHQAEQQALRQRVLEARNLLPSVTLNDQLLLEIAQRVAASGVRSLRADLATARAARALAALEQRRHVETADVDRVLPFALLHRQEARAQARSSMLPPPSPSEPQTSEKDSPSSGMERVFAPELRRAPLLQRLAPPADSDRAGPQLNVFASLQSAARITGKPELRPDSLVSRNRPAARGTRFIFLVDCSGSQAAKQRMRAVKGVVLALLRDSVRTEDEVAVIIFRGPGAQLLVPPTRDTSLAERQLELIPTGGRTPLAHGLQLAAELAASNSCLVVLTDGRANVGLNGGDPWQQALEIASNIRTPALVIDTSAEGAPQLHELARALRAELHRLDSLESEPLLALLRR